MKTLSGEVFVAKFDADTNKWTGHSGQTITCANAQHYLQWASTSLCPSKPAADSVLIELHPIGCILRVGENESQPIADIDVKALRDAERGSSEADMLANLPTEPVTANNADSQAYREISDWLANNYRLVLFKAYRAGRKFHTSSTRDSAQEIVKWILAHAENYDPSRGPVEAFCRNMLSFKLSRITHAYAHRQDKLNPSQLDGEIAAVTDNSGRLSAALPDNLLPQDRWILETVAQGYTLEEIGQAFNPSISKVAVHHRIRRAIAAVQEAYENA